MKSVDTEKKVSLKSKTIAASVDISRNITSDDYEPRQHQILDLRLRGYSYKAIAEVIGLDIGNTHKLAQRALEKARTDLAEKASDVFEIELRRIERMITSIERVVFPEDKVPTNDSEYLKVSLKAMEMMEKLLDRKAKLLGFYKTADSTQKEALPWSDDDL